jgi:hypothetical protein
MRSYPEIKLLVAVIAAIVAGITLHSWGWGIATFFILMFIFIFVASWIFGGSIRGKVEVDDELEFLLVKLETIGNIKNELPFNARGWCNSLGLFVQFREKGNLARLEAGDGKYRSQIDAWLDYSPGTEWPPQSKWKVKKYNRGDWEKLVNPTLDLATWLSTHGGLPAEYTDFFNTAVQMFKKEGHLELPAVRKAGEKPLGQGEPDDRAKSDSGKDVAETRTRIEEYDKELLEDIERLKKYISKEEDIGKELMRGYGAPEDTVSKVAGKARNEGRPIGSFGSNEDVLSIQTFLAEMGPVYKAFPFRLLAFLPELPHPARTNVITEDDWAIFDTRLLNNEERGEYAKQWWATRMLNYTPSQIPVYRLYPNMELVKFVEKMFTKYGTNSVLTKEEYIDENMTSVWKEVVGKGQA